MPYVLADAYLHRLDPFAIQFTETFGLRWYGLSYAAGFLIGWWIMRRIARSDRSPLTVESIGDLMFYIIAGVLVGGRVGYAAFYDPALFIDFSPRIPFWGLLALTKGGMASHGGMIGVIAASWIFAHRRGISALHLLDVGCLVSAPGLCLGRLANFVNGELWGNPLPASRQADPPAWSVKYPGEILLWRPDSAEDLAKLDALEPLRPLVGGDARFPQNLVDIAYDAGGREHQQVVATIEPLLTAFHPSQLYQALTDGPLLFTALALIWLRPRKPGVVGSWFLLVYGVMRLASELFRQADEGVTPLLGVVSRGQVLSIVMVLAGMITLPICMKRDVEKLGGLLPS